LVTGGGSQFPLPWSTGAGAGCCCAAAGTAPARTAAIISIIHSLVTGIPLGRKENDARRDEVPPYRLSNILRFRPHIHFVRTRRGHLRSKSGGSRTALPFPPWRLPGGSVVSAFRSYALKTKTRKDGSSEPSQKILQRSSGPSNRTSGSALRERGECRQHACR